MKQGRLTAMLVVILLMMPGGVSAARLKDVAAILGARSNQLVGYGLVVGLDGTGDDDKTQFTYQSMANMLEKMGIVVEPGEVDVDNIAGVMVTATLPPFVRSGARIDVTVSSMGNAENLQGGTLLMTPLKGADGQVYAVAQGAVSIGGFSAGGESGTSVQKNHLLVGSIPGGAIIEREVPVELARKESLDVILHAPDFTTSLRVAEAVARELSVDAEALDSGTVRIGVPAESRSAIVPFIARLEVVEVIPDTDARVVLNERTGTVVIGEHVRISRVAVAHGNLSILIKEQPGVSQPLPFSQGTTAVVPQSEVQIREDRANLILLDESASIGEVVRGLNAIGVTPRDLIAILQAIKASGALQARIELI